MKQDLVTPQTSERSVTSSPAIGAENGLLEASRFDQTVQRMCRRGIRRVRIERSVNLCAPSHHDLAVLACIRDLVPYRISVNWNLRAPTNLDLSALHALCPPSALSNAPHDLVAWHREFRFGLLFWRSGPGFVSVRDGRNGAVSEFTISDAAYLEVFHACQKACSVDQVPAAEAGRLIADRIVLKTGSFLLTLPYRMKYWPIPCNAI